MRSLGDCAAAQQVVDDVTQRIRAIEEQLGLIGRDSLYQDNVFNYWAMQRQTEPLLKEQHKLQDQWYDAMNILGDCHRHE